MRPEYLVLPIVSNSKYSRLYLAFTVIHGNVFPTFSQRESIVSGLNSNSFGLAWQLCLSYCKSLVAKLFMFIVSQITKQIIAMIAGNACTKKILLLALIAP